jgi:hypothetical protein
MEDEDYIGYSMEMHCMTPDQKLLYLKELDFFIKPIQEKINKLPKYEDDNSSY